MRRPQGSVRAQLGSQVPWEEPAEPETWWERSPHMAVRGAFPGAHGRWVCLL